MRILLESFFGKFYNSPKIIKENSNIHSGIVTFSDSKACINCDKSKKGCDKVVLKCDFLDYEVDVIDIENFINHFNNLKSLQSKKKCDLLFVNDQKIVFCELGCRQSKYLGLGSVSIGKRQEAIIQLRSTIEMLIKVPEIFESINKIKDKEALFAYRKKDENKSDEFDSQIKSNMTSFYNLEGSISKETPFSKIIYDFEFTQVCYPNVYIWNKV